MTGNIIMKSAEYYRRENEAHERALKAAKPRRSPFKVSKSTTANAKGYVVLFEMQKTNNVLRVQNGYVTWAAQNQAGTIFRTRQNAQAAIDAYEALYTHSCKMTKYDIVSVGEAEVYHG